MGEIRPHVPVLLFTAAFSRYPEALAWGAARAEQDWGPIAFRSEVVPFQETQFYEREMGADILKVLWGFETLIDPGRLVDLKLASNRWEEEYRASHPLAEARPLNLDPGYLTEAKLVLATTKDRDHRVYLGQGIFAEVTLHFQGGTWQARPWTYPDYRRPDYHQFLSQCREYLRQRYGRATSQRRSGRQA